MAVLMIFRIALKALGRNKMRTALTMLGMIIGVAAVITMVALGTGAQSSIDAQIQTMGTNTIQVMAGNFTQGGVRQGQGNASTLTPEDATAIKSVPGVLYVAASQNTRGADGRRQSELEHADGGDRRRLPPHQFVAGRSRGIFHAAGRHHGGESDGASGSIVRDQLFGPEVDPVGQVVRVQQHSFTIIGVMVTKGQSATGEDRDDRAFTPYTTVMKKMRGITFVQRITVVGRIGWRGVAGRRPHCRAAAGPPQDSDRRSRTTSWFARSRRWRASGRSDATP